MNHVNIKMEMPEEGAVCDFCSSPDVHWSFPARDVVTERDFGATVITPQGADIQNLHITHGSRGGWAACNVCAQLIKRGERDKLTRRAAKRQKRKLEATGIFTPLASIVALLRPLHDNFWANRQGEPVYHDHRPRKDPTE